MSDPKTTFCRSIMVTDVKRKRHPIFVVSCMSTSAHAPGESSESLSAATAGGARVLAMMIAAGADSQSMVAQSEQAFLAQGTGPVAPAVKILEYKEIEPFFVAGHGHAP
jgi:cytosine/adenosine deaminase-related metal-dependent hydrolase